jgi:hypothetical protein
VGEEGVQCVEAAVTQGGGDVCGTFTNEVNLLDLVADVQDIYRSFTANLTGVELRAD